MLISEDKSDFQNTKTKDALKKSLLSVRIFSTIHYMYIEKCIILDPCAYD